MKEPTKKTKSIPQNQIPEQDESDGDDEEINKLVQSSINLILPPAIQISNEKAFQNLTHKLTKSGATSQRKLQLYDNDESSSIKVTGKLTSIVLEADLAAKQLNSAVYSGSSKALCAPPLRRPATKKDPTATSDLGKKWFNLKPIEMNDELKRDIKLIEMRNYLDPKRFYKKADKIGTILHVGTVVEGPHEFKSSRLKRSERKLTIMDELMADNAVTSYSKKTFVQLQKDKIRKKVFRPQRKGKSAQGSSSKKAFKKLF